MFEVMAWFEGLAGLETVPCASNEPTFKAAIAVNVSIFCPMFIFFSFSVWAFAQTGGVAIRLEQHRFQMASGADAIRFPRAKGTFTGGPSAAFKN
jgi:hypothetical protein